MRNSQAKFQRISNKDIDAVVCFLPKLRSIPAPDVAHWPKATKDKDGVLSLCLAPVYHAQVQALMIALGKYGFIQPFDWARWQNRAEKFFQNPELLKKASIRTCIKLLTTHVRKDRFVGGHFGIMVSSGHFAAILQRLAELRNE